MLVLVGGRERSLIDFESLLREARFAVSRVISEGGVSILESRPV
jgi:hypothetical protein